MRLTSDANNFVNANTHAGKKLLLGKCFLLVKLMILLGDELSGPRAQSPAMLVLAGLLRFLTGRKIWREFCHILASIIFPALGTRLALNELRTILIGLSCCLCLIVVVGQS